jgi:FdhE protein
MTEFPLAGGVASIPEFRPIPSTIFADRARRLQALAPGHALEGYLELTAMLARAQQAMLETQSELRVIGAEDLSRCRRHGLPPLSVDAALDDGWRDALADLLQRLSRAGLPPEAERSAAKLRALDAATLDRDAANLLAGAFAELEPRFQPFIAAALQVHWVRQVLALGADACGAGVDFGLCPVCGSPPMVSAIRSGGAQQGLRYLVCSLCASEWHAVRIKCSHCASTKGISYLYVDGENDAVKAECCDECRTYLKILYFDKDNRMEPLADDLATLTLDMLVDERGFRRIGPNLLFAPGA